MEKVRSGFVSLVCVLALCNAMASGQVIRSDSALSAKPAEREVEFDPDAGTEAPFDEFEFEGEVAGPGTPCETIGGFTTTFTSPNRYRGNLYSITESGVFLKEIQMRLELSGAANLYVSVHQKMPNNSYLEVDINPSSPQGYMFIAVAQQDAGDKYYSTGLLNGGEGIELPPGQYAIGYSWGSENVKYGRDSVVYPKPMEVGLTLASVSRELSAPEPPLPAILPSLTQFAGGAYAMKLCFVPTEGACCLSDGFDSRCENLLEGDCVGEGSFFHGQRTTCKDTICEFGSCCFDCDTAQNKFVARCGDAYVAESCNRVGGIEFWSGLSCPADESLLCPKLVGACCNGTTCNLKCETECLAGGGTYEGDGTNCDPNTHVCKGACCVTGGCFDRTQSGCTGSNGTFHGRGTRCFSETCGGACCYGFTGLDFCEVFAERELCAYDPAGFPKMVYRGDGTTCPLDGNCGPESQYKACCLPEGQCMNTTQAVCTAPWIQGTYITTGTCDTLASNQCTNLQSRCCFNDGSCEILIGNACTARGGTSVVGETTCSATACNSTAGACCGTAIGSCTMKTASQCNTEGGFYRGDASDCTDASGTCPGFGACCRGNGECLENQTPSECATVGGAFSGAASVCATQHCDQRGACCAVTGTCLQITAGTCAGIDGDFKGVGVQCAPNICISGACCLPVDGCKKRTPAACAAGAGTYLGNDTSCLTQTCIVQGGCCRDGVCTVEQPADCSVNNGMYLGNGTACDENACVTGACCRIAGDCEDNAEQGGCAGPGEVFHEALTCLDVQCIPQGACCVDTDCAVTAEADCTGVYQGDGVECAFDSCPATGACCNAASCETMTQAACNSGGGTYQGDNVICDVDTCPEPTGACCDGANCSVTTEAACPGIYQSDGSDCDVNPCEVVQPCTAITSASPANCSIDARRPFPPSMPGSPEGWNSIALTFDCDTSNQTMGDYLVSVVPSGTAPSILSVVPNGTTITLNLSVPIPPGAWTCFTYTPADLMTCLGFLPADVDSNRNALPPDILALIDGLNGTRIPPLLINQCDTDRSGSCAPPDILTQIDLLNGANGYGVWNGRTLPVCPSAP